MLTHVSTWASHFGVPGLQAFFCGKRMLVPKRTMMEVRPGCVHVHIMYTPPFQQSWKWTRGLFQADGTLARHSRPLPGLLKAVSLFVW